MGDYILYSERIFLVIEGLRKRHYLIELTTLYLSSIVDMPLSITVSEIIFIIGGRFAAKLACDRQTDRWSDRRNWRSIYRAQHSVAR